GHDLVLVVLTLPCRLEVVVVFLDRFWPPVADRPGAGSDPATPAPSASTAERLGDTLGPRVIVGKRDVLSACRARSHLLTWSGRLALEAAESFDDVAEEARLALLAVGHDIDARFDLLLHHMPHRFAHLPFEFFAIVGLSLFPQSKKRGQRVGASQAAHMSREDSFRATLHRVSLL